MMPFQLASFGLNVVLISRSPSKLQATAEEIRKLSSLFSFLVFSKASAWPILYFLVWMNRYACQKTPQVESTRSSRWKPLLSTSPANAPFTNLLLPNWAAWISVFWSTMSASALASASRFLNCVTSAFWIMSSTGKLMGLYKFVVSWSRLISLSSNVVSMARMTHIVLPQMLNRQRGIIINIGSISGAFSTPLATIYAATKVTDCVLLCLLCFVLIIVN